MWVDAGRTSGRQGWISGVSKSRGFWRWRRTRLSSHTCRTQPSLSARLPVAGNLRCRRRLSGGPMDDLRAQQPSSDPEPGRLRGGVSWSKPCTTPRSRTESLSGWKSESVSPDMVGKAQKGEVFFFSSLAPQFPLQGGSPHPVEACFKLHEVESSGHSVRTPPLQGPTESPGAPKVQHKLTRVSTNQSCPEPGLQDGRPGSFPFPWTPIGRGRRTELAQGSAKNPNSVIHVGPHRDATAPGTGAHLARLCPRFCGLKGRCLSFPVGIQPRACDTSSSCGVRLFVLGNETRTCPENLRTGLTSGFFAPVNWRGRGEGWWWTLLRRRQKARRAGWKKQN